MNNNNFNGFEAFDEMSNMFDSNKRIGSSTEFDPNKEKSSDVKIETDDDVDAILEAVKENAKKATENKEDTEDEPIIKDDAKDKDSETKEAEEDLSETTVVTSEEEQISLFWDAFVETTQLDNDEDSKPKTVEEFFGKITEVIEEKSKPKYANETVEEIDTYVKNGGSVEDYFKVSEIENDFENIDLNKVDNQKKIVSEFLTRKGFTKEQISRKIDRYQDSDMLEDEANEAYDSLIDIIKDEKEELLKTQEIRSTQQKQAQQQFVENVVNEIDTLKDIRGIKIPEKDKKELMQYIFKVESDGTTRYQKDYQKSHRNLIESAYFTMKGDILINSAAKKGETDAVKKLRQALATKTTNKSSSRQSFENKDFISMLSGQLN